MKTFLILLLVPHVVFAQFKKPELIARYAGNDGHNMPIGVYCFGSEPAVNDDGIYLGCQDQDGHLMAHWKDGKYTELARAREEHLFSVPVVFSEGVAWHEFEEWGTTRSFVMGKELAVETIKGLGPLSVPNDSFLPLGKGQWLYRLKDDAPQLWSWSAGTVSPFFQQNVAFIFPPVVGRLGEVLIKIRKNNWDESAPDELWHYSSGQWKKIMEDRDANPASRWLSFRHQMSVDGEQALLVASDDEGEVLVLLEGSKVTEIVRRSGDIKEFDYFTPKLRESTIVFRGVDREGRKALWFHANGLLGRLVTQGDLVKTDLGLGRIHYESEHAIFYGAPGIGPKGEIVQQATLTDPDFPDTLMGIGLIRFERE